MKLGDLEMTFYKVLDLPLNYGYRLTNLDYLNLIAIAFDYRSVKELRQETLKKLMDSKDERVKEVLRCN